jgi:hypothetical protein
VRVEHFIEALLAESDSRIRLGELGYADNDEVRVHRFQLLARPMFTAGEVPADALGYSDRLKVWHRAAQQAAERREPELRTITVDDFVVAISEDLDLADGELRSLQGVLARYKQPPTLSFRSEAKRRFDQVDYNLEKSRQDIIGHVQVVGQKVDGVGGQVAEVSKQVSDAKVDTVEILVDTKALRASLPAEMRLSSFLLMMVMLVAAVGGACAGLLTRFQWGGL